MASGPARRPQTGTSGSWYTHTGLPKYLIAVRRFTVPEVVRFAATTLVACRASIRCHPASEETSSPDGALQIARLVVSGGNYCQSLMGDSER